VRASWGRKVEIIPVSVEKKRKAYTKRDNPFSVNQGGEVTGASTSWSADTTTIREDVGCKDSRLFNGRRGKPALPDGAVHPQLAG